MEYFCKSKRDLELKQVHLDNIYESTPIYLNTTEINSLGDLIFHLFKHTDNETYFKSGEIHCVSAKRRSADDLYLLCKSYGIDISLRKLDDLLFEISVSLFGNYNSKLINRVYCEETLKDTHQISNLKTTIEQINDLLDEKQLNIKINK